MSDRHGNFTEGQIHQVFNWSYADATARGAATGMVPADVGKWARQEDDGTYWELTDDSPVTWAQRTGTSFGGGRSAVSDDTTTVSDVDTIRFDPDVFDVDDPSDGDAVVTLSVAARTVALNFVIDGGGSAITTGVKGFVRVPFAWSDIAKASLLADQVCEAVVDVWSDTFANHPPTDADSITASAPLTLTGPADSVEDATLTGWDTTGSAGDVIAFNVDSNDDAELLTVVLDLVRAV